MVTAQVTSMMTMKRGKYVVIALLASVGMTGCGLKHWLGEAPPPTRIVSKEDASAQSGSGGDCDSWNKIYEGTEEESSRTFECWAAKEPDVWKKIRGAHPGELTEREISLIIRDGVISFDGGEAGRQLWTRRFIAIKHLLGFGPTITKERVDRWISWFRAHRSAIRSSYQKLIPFEKVNAFTYGDLQVALETAASFLRELEWKKSSTELYPLLRDAFAITDKQTLTGLEPGVRVVRNFLGYICPLQSEPTHLQPSEIAACFDKASAHFKPSARWVEFMINDKSSILEFEAGRIKSSISAAGPLIDKWFSQPNLNAIDTRLWLEFAKAMGAHPPDNFIDSLQLINKVDDKSDKYSIRPIVMNRVFALVEEYENLTLDAIPHFSRAYRSHQCRNENASSWKDCILKDFSVREKSQTIDMVLRVKNPRHGLEAVPLDGSVMSAIAFFDAAAEQMIQIFDENKDGVISVDIAASHDELVTFITSSIETYQSVDRYISNLGKRLSGVTLEMFHDNQGAITLSPQWNLTAFAKLVASSHDVLVERTDFQRTFFEKVLSNISNAFPTGSVFLDRPAITAILTTLTSLPHYRQYALEEILDSKDAAQEAMNGDFLITREVYRAHIGDMLKRNFPRTYQRCTEFGFEKSCGIAFDEIMPSPDETRKYISQSDLDLATITAIGMEGVFDTCGKKKDGTLPYSLLDGKDELDCGFNKMKEVGSRLIDSGVVQVSPQTKSLADLILNTINSTFVTRPIGKVALIRGTKSMPFLNLPLFWAFGKKATIGSAYGLLSDIVASDRVKEAKRRAK
jgi:hypothetical protein